MNEKSSQDTFYPFQFNPPSLSLQQSSKSRSASGPVFKIKDRLVTILASFTSFLRFFLILVRIVILRTGAAAG